MGKRILLFVVTNLAIVFMLTIVLQLLGLSGYIRVGGRLDLTALMIYSLVWGMGGAVISLMLSRADRIYLTEVDLEAEGDTRFPTVDPLHWREIGKERFPKGEKDDAAFAIRTLERRYR